jgi:hypothetical protein
LITKFILSLILIINLEVQRSWPSTHWFSLTCTIRSFMQFLRRRYCFQINGNSCRIHKISYKCLTWNIYNLYIKYTFSGWQFPLLLDLLSRFSIESVIHGRWTIPLAWHSIWQCLCRWEEINTTPHISQIHLSSSSPIRWGTHESHHGYRMTLNKMFSSNSIERNLSIDAYFIILACDAESASSSTTIKHELVFEECSHDSDFVVWSTVQ